jgi:hypothetical protein
MNGRVIEDYLGAKRYSFDKTGVVINWKQIGKQYADYFYDDSWQSSRGLTHFVEMFDEINDLRSENPDSALSSILEYFHEEFKPVNDPFYYGSANPEHAFITREGDPYALAFALNTILKKADFKTNIILVRDSYEGAFDERTPSFSAFNHALIKVILDDRERWIDPFNHYCGVDQLPWFCRGVDGMRVLKTRQHSFIRLSHEPSSKNRICSKTEAEIDKDGNLSGVTTVTMTGQYCLELRKAALIDESRSLGDELSETIKTSYSETYDGESINILVDSGDSIMVMFMFEEEGYADVSGNLMNIDMTRWVGTTLIDVFESETRKYDIQFPFPSIETSKITLKLPDGATVLENPSRGELMNDFIDYRRTVDLDGRSIELNRTLTLKVPRIKVADYQVMRQFATEVYDLDTETIVLEM